MNYEFDNRNKEQEKLDEVQSALRDLIISIERKPIGKEVKSSILRGIRTIIRKCEYDR